MSVSLSELNTDQMETFARCAVKRCASRIMSPIAKMELFLTENCTLSCDYCFVQGKDTSKRMTWDTAKKAVDFLMEKSADLPGAEIVFFGGEPLLEFALMKRIAEYGRQLASSIGKNLAFSVTTNGTIMNKEIVDTGRKYGFNYLLSVDGDKETHDRHRVFAGGREGSWDVVMGDNFQLLKSVQGWMGARVTVSRDTVGCLSSGVRALFDRGVNQFIIGPDMDTEWTQGEMDTLASEMHKVVDFYLEARARGLQLRIAAFEKAPEELQSKSDAWGCDAGRTRVAVSTDGDIYPCSKFVGPFPGMQGYRLGTIDQGITNVKALMDFIDNGADRRPRCAACDHRSSCSGGCPATSLHLNGSLFDPTGLECFQAKLLSDLLARTCSSQPVCTQ